MPRLIAAPPVLYNNITVYCPKTGGQDYMRMDFKKITLDQLVKRLARYNGQVVAVQRRLEQVMRTDDVGIVLMNIEDVEIVDGAQ